MKASLLALLLLAILMCNCQSNLVDELATYLPNANEEIDKAVMKDFLKELKPKESLKELATRY